MNPQIFREYDIRAVVDKELFLEEVITLGKAIGTYLRRQGKIKITLGRDGRLSSGDFRERLLAGLLATGCQVIDIGVCPTPLLYFSIRHLKTDGGVMITASHNPPEYNGFKICSGPDTIFGAEIQEIRLIVQKGEFLTGQGSVREEDVLPAYQNFVLKDIQLPQPLRVGMDGGNGTGGWMGLPIIRRLGCQVFDLYCEVDGAFPHHEPDPTVPKNLTELIDLVKQEHLDCGLAYDGDGDRLGVVDHEGNIIWGDQLMILFARDILPGRPGSTFIGEVKCSQNLYDDIPRQGGKVIMWKTGHSLIKQKMKEVQAVLAGEMSGHLFFADRYFGFDDAIYASMRLLEILSKTGKKIPELLSGLPKTFSTPEIRVETSEEKKFKIVEAAKRELAQKFPIIDVDGVRVLFEDGWGLIRASNTQPVLVLRFEAQSPARLKEIQLFVEGILRQVQENI
ncbi:MAG: phosphomannomutase/phosphoglucomutase [Deltaproteobacteria bacterium]|nr:phosphomannomutase/phosphoglucomutase [Deltaproteobacteria bacterium]